jgi:hypothetical protein
MHFQLFRIFEYYIYLHARTHTHTHYTMPHVRVIRNEVTQLHFEKCYVHFTYT